MGSKNATNALIIRAFVANERFLFAKANRNDTKFLKNVGRRAFGLAKPPHLTKMAKSSFRTDAGGEESF